MSRAFSTGRESDLVGVVALHVIRAVAVVDHGLENLDFLPGDLRALHPAKKFLGFAAEHAAANDFD